MTKKTIKVDDFHHAKAREKVDIRLDRDRGVFSITVSDGQAFEDKDLATVKRLAGEYLDSKNLLHLEPVIHIEMLSPFADQGAFLGFKYHRLYVGQLNSRWYQLSWATMEYFSGSEKAEDLYYHASLWDFAYHKQDLVLPYRGDEDFVLPYTKALWDGVAELEQRVLLLRTQFLALMNSQDLQAKLAQLSRYLPEGPHDPTP